MNQRAGPTFSNIRRLPASQPQQRPADKHLEVQNWFRLAIARLVGITTALLVLMCFFGLFFCFKISGAEKVARGEVCPRGLHSIDVILLGSCM